MQPDLANLFRFDGKDIWVFGGAGYLGQPVVAALTSAGAKVLCADLGEKAAEFVAAQSLGARVTPAALDVRDTEAMRKFVSDQIAQRGVPHGLVNLTYSSTAQRLENLTDAEFDAVGHGSLTATFALAREVGTHMAKAQRGSIVLFSSMYGTVSPDPGMYATPMTPNPIEYGVTKAGLQQMSRYLAVHWGRQNVRVNCISPGPFPNPKIQRELPDFIQKLAQKSPLGRVGQAPEIAGAVVFLLSDAASYLTGHNLAVDGGWTAW